ncbi:MULTISPECIES: response regulator transcription factor [unclassified Bradyrhizobium]|uniref:LuxR C-terminal-related transcriptional regulator n=1 Tax=unclassified Bradyrhizobium TaxID=2631580 RepID=UPI0024789671|nr:MULTISPECIES: response regulator transcription factor [unclassified Bradyrhizobium]WGR70571.1 response regulator transcription factor [Bradyrhizobium sp. ISRA426]WGR75408.1 response regulator transcription factor [Bradyrhizobium sp. ISRA430]WGR85811.1 response regulator transcription factor [Bradyrhizobium sp. ISRA432]
MGRRNSLRIVLVGNGSLLKEEVARILRSANFRIAASVSRAEDFLSSKLQSRQLLFLIVHTCDDFAVVAEQIDLLRHGSPGRQIAVVADRYRQEEMAAAFRTASSYFVGAMPSDLFIKSIELVMMGEVVLPTAFLRSVFAPKGALRDNVGPSDANNEALATPQNDIIPQLSPREKAILRCLVEGESNKSIARKFQVTEGTVKTYVRTTLCKIRVSNRTQAAIWAMHNRWLARTISDSSPPPASGADIHFANASGLRSGVGQIEGSMPPTGKPH